MKTNGTQQLHPDMIRHDWLAEFIEFHSEMYSMGDIDPSNPMLRYVCNRFELNVEQRYWVAWLFACCYNAATAFYMYNEFPDFENVDVGRLQRWWEANRERVIFQTDRRWVRSRNQFVDMFESYRYTVAGHGSQEAAFAAQLCEGQPIDTYLRCYKYFIKELYQFGRFAMFLYLEAVHVCTDFPITPSGMDMRHAQSSRNGLAYAMGFENLLTGHDYGRSKLSKNEYVLLDESWDYLLGQLKYALPGERVDAWNVETTLCAFKKWHRGKRYPGYYLDRQANEIVQMERNVPEGVDWSVLWDFRKETFDHEFLSELTGHSNKETANESSGDWRRTRNWQDNCYA